MWCSGMMCTYPPPPLMWCSGMMCTYAVCVDSPQSCVDGVQYAMASGDYEKVVLQVSVCACVCMCVCVLPD